MNSTPGLAIITILAAVCGLAVVLAPLANMILKPVRARGRTIGSGASLRTWPALAGMTIGFLALGYILWIPLPLELTGELNLVMLVLGSILYFPAVGIYLWGYWVLGKEFGVSTSGGADVYADHRMITAGPYRYVRHPMYLAVMLAAAGGALIFRTWAVVIFLPMSLVVIRRANLEESLLAEEFPEEWQDYKNKVPKWLPCCPGSGLAGD